MKKILNIIFCFYFFGNLNSQNSLISLSESIIVYVGFDNLLEFTYEGNYDSLFIKSDKVDIKNQMKNSAVIKSFEEGKIEIDLYRNYKNENQKVRTYLLYSFKVPIPSLFVNDSLIYQVYLTSESIKNSLFKLAHEKGIPLQINYLIKTIVFEINGIEFKNKGSKINQEYYLHLNKSKRRKRKIILKRIEYVGFDGKVYDFVLDRVIY